MRIPYTLITENYIDHLVKTNVLTATGSIEITTGNSDLSVYTLVAEQHPIAMSIKNSTAKVLFNTFDQPVDSLFLGIYSLFGYLNQISSTQKVDSVIVGADHIAQASKTVYDYKRDPYKDSFLRSDYFITSYFPISETDYFLLEDGSGFFCIDESFVGKPVQLTYSCDMVHVVKFNCSDLFKDFKNLYLIKNDYIPLLKV